MTARPAPARAARRARLAWLTALVVALAVTGDAPPAVAAPHKVLVLPAEGTADPGARAKLTTQLGKLARRLDGEVATADATFADTALAVGCDPRVPRCADDVMTTLGVDELIWATATKDGPQTRVVTRRVARGAPARTLAIAFTTGDPDARDQIDAGLGPLFAPPRPAAPDVRLGPAGAPTEVAPDAAPAAAAPPPTTPPPDDHHDRNVGIALATGGGVALVLGIALWASAASLQDRIDHHPTRTSDDIADLRALEDRASSYAITGDVAVVAGLAVGGLGAYYLLRDRRVAVRPTPIAHGAALTLEIVGGL